MSTPFGALAPAAISGEVVTPSAIIDPVVMPAHDFFNVIRHVLRNSSMPFHNESDLHEALDKVDKFEHAFLKGDHKYVVKEGDPAGREDVSQRVPPNTGYAVPVNVPQIDYSMLARAILQAQAEANAQSELKN